MLLFTTSRIGKPSLINPSQSKIPRGGTLVPLIIATDETSLSTFSGDKYSYPVYLTIGNIAKDLRRKPSVRATILLAYLPTPELACCTKDTHADKYREVFHTSMRLLLEPLVEPGQKGVRMLCSDRKKRHTFPILAAYVADFPEQCLVACIAQSRCPAGRIPSRQRGSLAVCHPRDPKDVLEMLRRACEGRPVALK